MTLIQMETIRDSIKAQLDAHVRGQCAPGQDVMKCCNEIELRAALRTAEQFVGLERASLVKPPGATGPVLVGV